ncbi:MAG: ribbon-helix-helix protein, CopG family [Actinomycetota bacterium]|nr:ribbon-helix-helix protein, CopG family [Actinomycetota bacterium]
MRTTVTLDDDVAAELQRLARERGAAFKDVLNDVLRVGLGGGAAASPYRVPSRALGLQPGVDLTKALAVAAADEDAETLRKLALRK